MKARFIGYERMKKTDPWTAQYAVDGEIVTIEKLWKKGIPVPYTPDVEACNCILARLKRGKKNLRKTVNDIWESWSLRLFYQTKDWGTLNGQMRDMMDYIDNVAARVKAENFLDIVFREKK